MHRFQAGTAVAGKNDGPPQTGGSDLQNEQSLSFGGELRESGIAQHTLSHAEK